MPDLLKAAFLLERNEGVLIPTGKIPFTFTDEDGSIRHMLLLDPEVYDDLDLGDDMHAEITVVIYPGDALNDERLLT